ncbi:MAG: AAA family ATPase, partial [Caldilineaceae bacterium]|nr:AAA family ATPase [Caldilineaceae bacterium]
YRALHPLPQARKARGIRGLHAAMIGRDAELAVLMDAFAAVQQGAGQAVFVTGDAGVGKSRLVAEFRAALAQAGAPAGVLWLEGRCLEMSTAAGYWPFRAMLRDYFGWQFEESAPAFAARVEQRLRTQAAAARWAAEQLDEIGAVIGTLLSLHFGNAWDARLAQADAAHLRYRIITGVSRFLFDLAAQEPTVLVLEDLHWADDLSLDLLVQLLDELARRPVLLLCVHRPAHERRAGQLAAIAAAKCPGHTQEINLHALTPADTTRLVEQLLETEALEQQTKRWILARAQGNPFFTEEVVRALIDAGLIIRRAARWESAAHAATDPAVMDAVPHSVDSLIHTRVDRLTPPLRQTLQRAAVIGRTLALPVLHRLAADEEPLDRQLWELETRGFLYQERAVPDPEYSFHHVLTQEAVYRMIPRDRRMDLHHQTAVALEAVYAGELEDQVERLAYHYAQTDDHAKAVDYLLRAGRKARRAYLHQEAVAYFRAALSRLDLTAPQAETQSILATKASTLYELGRVLYALGRMEEAEPVLRDAVAAGRAARQDAHELAFTYFWLCEALFWLDKYDEHIAAAQEGLNLLPAHDKSTAAVVLTGHIAICSEFLGDYATFWRLTDWFGDFIADLPFREELTPAYHFLIDGALATKDAPRALALAHLLEEKARARDDIVSQGKALYLHGRCLSVQGAPDAARQPLEQGLRFALRTDETTLYGFIMMRLASDAVLMGRMDEGRSYAEEWQEKIGPPTSALWPSGRELLGWICLTQRDTAAARQYLQAALDAAQVANFQYLPDRAIWLGWAYLADGDRAQAHRCFADALARVSVDEVHEHDEPERKPSFAEALAGLEASADPAAFRAMCAELRARDRERLGRFTQWYLEPATVTTFAGPRADMDVAAPPAAPWRWIDPRADSRLDVEDGLVIAAADGRDLWYV